MLLLLCEGSTRLLALFVIAYFYAIIMASIASFDSFERCFCGVVVVVSQY